MKNDRLCHHCFLPLLLIALLLTALFGCASSMAEVSTGNCGPDLTWMLDESGTLTISGSGEMNDFSSPAFAPWYESRQTIISVTVDGNVTKIGKYAFYMCTNLTSVILPDSVLTIDYYSFANCYSLVSINMPASLTSISQGAFYQAGLTGELTIPEGITCISRTAFFGTNLSSINWNENITTIERGAFERCRLLTTVSIPSSVINLGDEVFRDCSGLTSITIPESIISIGSRVFYGCESLENLTIPGTVSTIGESAFSNCTSLKQLEILEGITSIGNSAFSYCSSLESIFIPSTITSIGNGAFLECNHLTDVYYYGKQADWSNIAIGNANDALSNVLRFAGISDMCGRSASYTLYSDGTLFIRGTGEITASVFSYDRYGIKNVVIEEGITSIGYNAFTSCETLESVTLPNSLSNIGNGVFLSCYHLINVDWPESLTSIPDQTFNQCRNLTHFDFPSTVTSIGSYAFGGCGFTELILPAGLQSIAEDAFSGCSSLSGEINIPAECDISSYPFPSSPNAVCVCTANGIRYNATASGATAIGPSNSSLKEIIFLDSFAGVPVTVIADDAFYSQYSNYTLQGTVTIPDSVITIGNRAFYNCEAITSLNLGSGVTVIGDRAFYHCRGLTGTLTIPDNVITIGDGAFYTCDNLTGLNLGNGVTSIGSSAFTSYYGSSMFPYYNGKKQVAVPRSASYSENSFPSDVTVTPFDLKCKGIWYAMVDSVKVSTCKTTELYSYRTETIDKTIMAVIGHEAELSSIDLLSEVNGIPVEAVASGVFEYAALSMSEPLIIPDSIKYIGNDSFRMMTGLTGLQLGNNIEIIGQAAFSHSKVPSTYENPLIIPDSVKVLSDNAFNDCCITGLVLGNGLEYLFDAFPYQSGSGISGVNGILTIPASVTHMYSNSFYSALDPNTKVYFMGKNPFENNTTIPFNVYVPHHDTTWNSIKIGSSCVLKRYCPEQQGSYENWSPVQTELLSPTCIETGYEPYWYCPVCNTVFTDETAGTETDKETFIIEPTGHTYGLPIFSWQEDDTLCNALFSCIHGDDEITVSAEVNTPVLLTEPNCTETGLSELTAAVQFSAALSEEALAHAVSDPEDENLYQFSQTIQHTIPALGHTPFVSLSAVEPKCTKSGRTEEIICDVCGEPLQESTALPALGHHYLFQQAVWDETHTACQMIFECERCSDQIQEAAQIETEVLLEATCTEAGATRWTATLNYEGETYTDTVELNVPEALGHTIAIDPAVPQTDRETGLTEGSHCSICGEILTAQKIIPANWSYSDDGLTVTAYNGTETDLTIPEGVTHLGNTLFKDNASVTSVTVPDAVTVLGTRTFYGASALQHIYLSPSVTQFYSQTFFNTDCRIHTAPGSSTAVQLAIRGLRFEADENWTLLQRATNSDEGITSTAVASYNGTATEIIIPDEFGNCPVTELLSGSFADHPSLTSLTVPDTVTVIEEGTFAQDHQEIVIRSAYTAYAREWALENGFIWEHSSHTEQLVPGKEPTCTEDGLSDGRICSECGKILAEQEVLPALGHQPELIPAVPATMTHTGLTEGSRCSVCGEILTAQEIIPAWGPMDDPDFTLPAQLKLIEDEALSNIAAEVIFIPNGVLSIGRRAFSGCSLLRQIYIPSSVTEFGESIFEGCSKDLLIYGENGSPAETWAEQNGLLFVRMP